ncbi:Transmembrane 18 isoform B [Micractinium conductrix]|uniref:Transmembrane 18 isoform B n=1 Tax=Micractinium conductrix TaxID=554055 RepID=A0A2P6V2W9_9CHLO|nr:Transmembrane 18 isoform B [Micractinium conductrix]|eukprot:PSC68436.1 Transmembrane 18 isoform B [Micractinium conductrix]
MEGVSQQVGEVREQLAGAMDVVLDDLRQKWRELSGGPSVTEGLKRFVAAVDWSERWIQGLLAFHCLLLIFVVAFRRLPGVHAAVFFGIMPVVYFAERINALAATHWRSFSSQNYFDSQGIFTSALLSAPLLFIMLLILFHYLFATSALLIRMKRKELEYKAREAARQARGERRAGGADGGGGNASRDAKKERLPPAAQPEVLLIRRAKEPSNGLWCFPGGSLELGESLVDCAVRETLEETGLQLRNAAQEGELFSDTLAFPSPVSSSDAMMRDPDGRLLFHYAIVNYAAVPETPVPADDVDGAQWWPVAQLRGLKDLVLHCDRVAERAVRQYSVTH